MGEALVHNLTIGHDPSLLNILRASVGDLGLVGVGKQGDPVDVQSKLVRLHDIVQVELPGHLVVLHLQRKQARVGEVLVAEAFLLFAAAELYELALPVVRGGDDVPPVVINGVELALPIVAASRVHHFVVADLKLLFLHW